jgi:phosphoserine phosphatase RsbU/P
LWPRIPDSIEINALLSEVDDALRRLSGGSCGLCDQCGDPIEKERLLADPLIRFCLDHLTAQERRALEDDMETAREVQKALLPVSRRHPGWEIDYIYEPAGVVSGDYCDIVASNSDETSLLVLLGDVAGKGVSAALLMSHLHAMFRSLSTQGCEVSQTVERANRLLCESTQKSGYATLVCVRAALDGELAVCNAGHCSPLVFRRTGVSMIASTGLPLGLFSSGHFSTTNVRLDVGDILFLYSDGLIESENPAGEEYGVDRLKLSLQHACELPSAEATVQTCKSALRNFLEAAKSIDDLTLMVVRRI